MPFHNQKTASTDAATRPPQGRFAAIPQSAGVHHVIRHRPRSATWLRSGTSGAVLPSDQGEKDASFASFVTQCATDHCQLLLGHASANLAKLPSARVQARAVNRLRANDTAPPNV